MAGNRGVKKKATMRQTRYDRCTLLVTWHHLQSAVVLDIDTNAPRFEAAQSARARLEDDLIETFASAQALPACCSTAYCTRRRQHRSYTTLLAGNCTTGVARGLTVGHRDTSVARTYVCQWRLAASRHGQRYSLHLSRHVLVQKSIRTNLKSPQHNATCPRFRHRTTHQHGSADAAM